MAQQIKGKYISNDAIDGTRLLLLADQALRQEGPLGDIFDLVRHDSLEDKVYVKGEEVGYKSQIDQEASDRSAADSVLQGNIDVEKGRIDAILEASSADKDSFKEIVDLINSVDTENDEAFAAYVLSNDEALAQEVSDRQSGDDEIKGLLDGLESYTDIKSLNDAIVAEESARASADSTLQGNIESEASARSSADSVLQGNIESEESARVAADGVLQGNIDSEESARIAGDASLQSQINDIVSNVDPLALDSLSEIVTAFQEADSDLNEAITSVLGTHTSGLAGEVAAREAADVQLQSNIDSEASTRASSDESIQKFTGEVDRDPLDSTELDLSGSVNSNFANYDTFSLMGGASSLKDASAKLNAGLAEMSGYVANLKFKKEAFTSVQGDFLDGRDLGHQPLENSTSVTVGRLTLLEGIDYEIVLPQSAEDPTKIRLIGNGQADSLDTSGGEDIYVSYYCFDMSFMVTNAPEPESEPEPEPEPEPAGYEYFTGVPSQYTGSVQTKDAIVGDGSVLGSDTSFSISMVFFDADENGEPGSYKFQAPHTASSTSEAFWLAALEGMAVGGSRQVWFQGDTDQWSGDTHGTVIVVTLDAIN